MALKFAEILNQTKKITVPIGDEQLELTFKLGFYTPTVSAQMISGDDPTETQIAVMADAIVGWNFVDEAGKMTPITADNLRMLGMNILHAIYNAMIEAVLPNPKKADS